MTKKMGLREALRYVRAEARERAEICVNSVNVKGALEIAVTGLWNIETAAGGALGLTEPTHAELVAARPPMTKTTVNKLGNLTRIETAARRWRVLHFELLTMQASQSDEMGFSDGEIEPLRRRLEEAEAELQLAVDELGPITTDEHLSIMGWR